MINVLLWNVNRKPLERIVASLVRQHSVDAIFLVECEIPDRTLLRYLYDSFSTPPPELFGDSVQASPPRAIHPLS